MSLSGRSRVAPGSCRLGRRAGCAAAAGRPSRIVLAGTSARFGWQLRSPQRSGRAGPNRVPWSLRKVARHGGAGGAGAGSDSNDGSCRADEARAHGRGTRARTHLLTQACARTHARMYAGPPPPPSGPRNPSGCVGTAGGGDRRGPKRAQRPAPATPAPLAAGELRAGRR